MDTIITKKLLSVAGEDPLNEFNTLISSYAIKSDKPGFNSWTIGIACILNTEIADNVNVTISEGYEMIDKIAAAKQIELDTTEAGTNNYLWYIEIKKELEDFHSVVEARIKDGKTGKRGGRTMVQMST